MPVSTIQRRGLTACAAPRRAGRSGQVDEPQGAREEEWSGWTGENFFLVRRRSFYDAFGLIWLQNIYFE